MYWPHMHVIMWMTWHRKCKTLLNFCLCMMQQTLCQKSSIIKRWEIPEPAGFLQALNGQEMREKLWFLTLRISKMCIAIVVCYRFWIQFKVSKIFSFPPFVIICWPYEGIGKFFLWILFLFKIMIGYCRQAIKRSRYLVLSS